MMKNDDNWVPNSPFLEKLAELEHDQWMEWMYWLMRELADKDMSFFEYMADCQRRELFVPYSQLTEEQKESDRKFARKIVTMTMGFDLKEHS